MSPACRNVTPTSRARESKFSTNWDGLEHPLHCLLQVRLQIAGNPAVHVKHDHEFVSADPGYEVRGPEAVSQAAGNDPEDLAAG